MAVGLKMWEECGKRVLHLARRPFAGKKQRGMTLIEIIIVITLLATLMTILISNLSSKSDQAKVDQARIAMGNIAQALQLYRVHNNKYPTPEEGGLNALISSPSGNKRWRGPYIEKEKLNDPWGNAFDYQSDGRTFKIISGGLNGVIGGDTEITYPEEGGGSAESGSGGTEE